MSVNEFERLWALGRRQEALAVARAAFNEPDPAAKQAMAEALVRSAQATGVQHTPDAEAAVRTAVSLRQVIWPLGHPHAPYAELALVDFLKQQRRWPEAEVVLHHCWERAETPAAQKDIAFEFARLYLEWGRETDAERYLKQAIDLDEINQRSGHPRFGLLLGELQELYRRQGRFAEAARIAEQRLTDAAPAAGTPALDESERLAELATLWRHEGRPEDALEALHRALAIAEQAGGNEHSAVGRRCRDVGETLLRLARPDAAVPMFRRALRILSPVYGESDPEILALRQRLAEATHESRPKNGREDS
jgi:tetratricopeptide (TPR) repeat protein